MTPLHSITALLWASVNAPPRWRFDLRSALIGVVAGLILAGVIYRYRATLRRWWEQITAPLIRLYHRLELSTEQQYLEKIAIRASALILPRQTVTLNAVFIEPELAHLPAPPQSTEEIESAPGDSPSLPLRQVLGGHNLLAILGAPGAGKTTLLAYVALASARVKTPFSLPTVQERLPLFVFLPAMDWSEPVEGDTKTKPVGPLDRLIQTAISSVESGGPFTNLLRQFLRAGRATVLVDGWDELPPAAREQAAAWIAAANSAAPGNLWLVSAGLRGYAPLTEAGFVPLRLAHWDGQRVESFIEQWMEAFPGAEQAAKKSTPAHRRLVAALRRASRDGVPPFELALWLWVYLTDGQRPAQRAALFDRALDLTFQQEKDPRIPVICRAVASRLALQLLQETRPSAAREEIEAAIAAAVAAAFPSPEEPPPRGMAAQVFRALTGERGLLCTAGPNRYMFAHSLWQSYLAAREMAAAPPAELAERLGDPAWAEAFRFYAEIADMGPLAAAWLRVPDDLFLTRLRTLSEWIRVAPEGAAWSNNAMALLARGFVQANRPAPVRHLLAESLAATGVPGVTYLFKQALQHPDAGVRTAAVLGLSRAAKEADLPALNAAMKDPSPAVREAVVRGLGYIGLDAARLWLERLITEGDEWLSLVAAETITQYGKEGDEFLHGAVKSDDAMIRRAAVVGLARLNALDTLEATARQDEQWIVRAAAAAAVEEIEAREKIAGVAPPPDVAHLPWLISWAAGKGESVAVGEAAHRMLVRALAEGEAPIRIAAARALALVGNPEDVAALRKVLGAPEPEVNEAVLDALAEIGARYDLKIE